MVVTTGGDGTASPCATPELTPHAEMPEPKDGESFLRKVVRFVANPTTDWADLNSRHDATGAGEIEKSELKAMVERKRRNDFVRKSEFDMLRRVRREGLTPEQLAALGGTVSRLDSEAKLSDSASRGDGGVKAKIDEIEQQMVGDAPLPAAPSRPAGFFDAPTEPAAFRGAVPPTGGLSAGDGDVLPALPPLPDPDRPPPPPAPVVMGGGLPPLAGVEPGQPSAADALGPGYAAGAKPPPVEFTEVQHDPELDEAVIAFANADFDQCERSLDALTAIHGPRAQHGETWLVRFDLYRATGQQDKFEALALDYAQRFGWSAPQWFSLPRLVADAVAEQRPASRRSEPGESVGWVCPEVLDADAVARLRSQTLQMPLPWVFDWSQLASVEVEGAVQLTELMRHWASQSLDMRWHSGERLLTALAEQAPTGLRDADPAFWVARLEVLRLANRPDQFDEVAIDYCVTYEVSPPSWERAKCRLRISGPGRHTHAPALSQVSGVSTTFFESSLIDEAGVAATTEVKMASVELSGQLVGGIDDTLGRLDDELGDATLINVSCARLIRVDFLAAGDLLNWVLAKRGEGRQVSFADAHRLVALFFGAMGINEHAKVRVRHV